MPGNSFPKIGFNFIDLVVHFIMYALLAFLLFYSLIDSIHLNGMKFIFKIWGAIVIFGGFIEILQETIAIKRYFSAYDILFNAIGAAFIFILYKTRKQTHENNSTISKNSIS